MLIGVLPLVINRLPAEDVAIWYAINSFLLLSVIVEAGFTPTFVRLYAYASAGTPAERLADCGTSGEGIKDGVPNADSLDRIDGTIQRVFFLTTCIYTIILWAVGSWILHPLLTAHEDPKTGWTAWLVVCLCQPLLFHAGKYNAYLTGTGNVALNQRMVALVSLLSSAGMIMALLMGGGLISLACILQAGGILGFIRGAVLSRRVNGARYRDSVFGRFDSDVWSAAWSPAWRSALGNAATIGSVQLSGLLYARAASPIDGASYLLGLRLITVIAEFSNAPFYAHIPTYTRFRVEGHLTRLANATALGMKRSLVVFVAGFLMLGIFAAPLLDLVGKDVSFPAPQIWCALGIAFLIQRIGAMHLQIYSTTNRIVWHWVGLGSVVVFAPAALLLVDRYGVIGIPLAMAISYLLTLLPISAFLSYRSLSTSPWAFERKASILSVGAMTVACLILMIFSPHIR